MAVRRLLNAKRMAPMLLNAKVSSTGTGRHRKRGRGIISSLLKTIPILGAFVGDGRRRKHANGGRRRRRRARLHR